MQVFSALPPLSLYVHLPWCVSKCPYCDFNSHALRGTVPEHDYANALLTDLDQELPDVWGRPVTSVFIGGGTPSLFSPRTIDRLLSEVRARLPLVPDCEITMEANPGSAELAKLREFRSAGVNRLSIGVQSFDARYLKALGRAHGSAESLAAAKTARDAGFDNFNLDLMFALPGQSTAEAVADIDSAIGHEAPHLSCYQLTIEPNTTFHHAPPELPGEEDAWAMQCEIYEHLAAAGYVQYEVSAFARERQQCRHNLNYWRFGDYLGIGAGAHAKITHPDRVVRRWKLKHPAAYMEHAGGARRIGGEHELTAADLVFEFMLNALRLREPVGVNLFQLRTGQAITPYLPVLESARDDGLLRWDGLSVSATDTGYRFLNDLQQRFLPDA